MEIESEWSGLGMNPEAAMQMGEEQMRLCEKLKFQVTGIKGFKNWLYIMVSGVGGDQLPQL